MRKPGELIIGGEVPDARATSESRLQDRCESRSGFLAFVARSAVFFTPLLLGIVMIEALLWQAGETWPLPQVIQFQEKHPHSFFDRLVIDQATQRYKYLQVLRRRPQILVLGSSRMRQFRAEMFGRQAAVFYNGGGMIHSLEDLRDFFDRLPPEATPKTVILGLDFWWLNGDEKKLIGASDFFRVTVETDGALKWQAHANAIAGFLRQPVSLLQAIRTTFGTKRDPNAIGLQARLQRQGFRLDGSKRIDLEIPSTPDEWRERLPSDEFLRREILDGHSPFTLTNELSPALLERLRGVVSKMQKRGVFVIGYNPPIVGQSARVLPTAPHQKDFWREYHEQVPELFHQIGLPFFDIVTPQQLGLDDRYMRDWCHTHDTFDLNVLQHFCDDPKIRALFPDVPAVAKRALSSPRTNPLYLDLTDQ
jgi:hypothetical protein